MNVIAPVVVVVSVPLRTLVKVPVPPTMRRWHLGAIGNANGNVTVMVGLAAWPVPADVTVKREFWLNPPTEPTDAVVPQPADRATLPAT